MSRFFFLATLLFSVQTCLYGQAGMTVNASRLYYKFPPGGSGVQKMQVQNPNDKDLEVGISINDWDYDSTNNNRIYEAGTLSTSCAGWIKILPASYFILKPHETKTLDIVVAAPVNADTSIPVHTAMLYITQLNPGEGKSTNGAALKVTVRMGVKVYHSFLVNAKNDLEITDFKDIRTDAAMTVSDALEIAVANTGKTWMEGQVKIELLNVHSGKKIKMDPVNFYALPGDHLYLRPKLPGGLEPGTYTATAIVNYGAKDELKVAELDFAVGRSPAKK